ncbi:hypothetical protein PARMER_00881 [Parabacteroides merdae ATCC 43184]|nr:hypothetical protein PARMER_00881 [Parabacteroides merdae ATCC 43184]
MGVKLNKNIQIKRLISKKFQRKRHWKVLKLLIMYYCRYTYLFEKLRLRG